MIRLVLAAALLSAQPKSPPPGIGQNGVVNAASHIPPTLAGGDLAPGAIVTITGVRLGSMTRTSLTISHGGKTIQTRLIAVGPQRIDALLPRTAPTGESALVVTVDGQATRPFPVRIAASNPGLFTRNGLGWGPGSIDNLGSGARQANSLTNSARPGQQIVLLATGLAEGHEATVVVGNRTIKAGRARAGSHLGEQEITFAIPTDILQGCYVPVYLLAAPGRASNVVTVSIHSGAGACQAGAVPLLGADRAAVVLMTRSRIKDRQGKRESVNDEATITFASKGSEPVLSPLLLLPPPGSCTGYTGSFQENTVLPGSIADSLMQELEGRGLDAGSAFTLTRVPAAGATQKPQTRTIAHERGVPGFYRSRLGNNAQGRRAQPLFLNPGDFTLAAPGGKDVGQFQVRFAAPQPFEWINREDAAVVDRGRPLVVRWQKAPASAIMVILATNVDQVTTAIGTSLCTARAGDGQFTIPAAMLKNIPASVDIPGVPYDQLFVATLPESQPPQIRATGINASAVISLYSSGRFVRYQ